MPFCLLQRKSHRGYRKVVCPPSEQLRAQPPKLTQAHISFKTHADLKKITRRHVYLCENNIVPYCLSAFLPCTLQFPDSLKGFLISQWPWKVSVNRIIPVWQQKVHMLILRQPAINRKEITVATEWNISTEDCPSTQTFPPMLGLQKPAMECPLCLACFSPERSAAVPSIHKMERTN